MNKLKWMMVVDLLGMVLGMDAKLVFLDNIK